MGVAKYLFTRKLQMNNKNIFSKFTLLLFLIIPILSCHFLKENSTPIKKDYLYVLWVERTIEDNKKLPQEEISTRSKEAKLLIEKTLILKKKKELIQSIQILENAIDKEINAEVYYEYANVLSSAKRFHDAIKAYEISLKLDYKRPELVLYNIACSYSLLSDEANTYKYLEKAIQKGYKAFEYMEKDPDLKNVRDKNKWEWDERIRGYALPDIYLKEENVHGFIGEGMPRPASYYFLCKNGIALRKDFREKLHSFPYVKGEWKIVDNKIEFFWKEICGSLSFPNCRNIFESTSKLESDVVSRFEYYQVKSMLSGLNIDLWHRKTKSEPPHCNPDFKPRNIHELDVVKYFRDYD